MGTDISIAMPMVGISVHALQCKNLKPYSQAGATRSAIYLVLVAVVRTVGYLYVCKQGFVNLFVLPHTTQNDHDVRVRKILFIPDLNPQYDATRSCLSSSGR